MIGQDTGEMSRDTGHLSPYCRSPKPSVHPTNEGSVVIHIFGRLELMTDCLSSMSAMVFMEFRMIIGCPMASRWMMSESTKYQKARYSARKKTRRVLCTFSNKSLQPCFWEFAEHFQGRAILSERVVAADLHEDIDSEGRRHK